MSLREQFDQWVKDRRPDKYPAEWEAFQAGHAAGLEAAKKEPGEYYPNVSID